MEEQKVGQSVPTYKGPGDYHRFIDQVKSALLIGICPTTISPPSVDDKPKKHLSGEVTEMLWRDPKCRWTD